MFKPVRNTAGKTKIQTVGLWLVLALLLSACQPISAVSTVNKSVITAVTEMAAADQAQCALDTLKGRYLFATYGTILPPAFGVTEPTEGASAGFHTFNGDGTGTDTVTVRVGSAIVRENVVVPIRYTVNADCTGAYTVLIDGGPSFDLFIAPKGEAIAVISTAPPGNYVSSIDLRVSAK
ncbi:MAG: hypothetical protein DYG89_50000 [Caldilinea sp. CFX5]|nr:hypothetical protein [Caldilinea sp. CFX5]